jgi:hypothetical protein
MSADEGSLRAEREHEQNMYRADRDAMFKAADGSMMCEAHPGHEWPHDDCAGPGMPWILEGRTLITEALEAELAQLRTAQDPSAQEAIEIARRLADVYTVDTDQIAVIRLVQEAHRWARTRPLAAPCEGDVSMCLRHFNELTPAEAERLALLLEELGEAQQVIGKILRHGYESSDPTRPDSPTNREMLEREFGDIHYAGTLMIDARDLNQDIIERYAKQKAQKAQRYLHHQQRRQPTPPAKETPHEPV